MTRKKFLRGLSYLLISLLCTLALLLSLLWIYGGVGSCDVYREEMGIPCAPTAGSEK